MLIVDSKYFISISETNGITDRVSYYPIFTLAVGRYVSPQPNKNNNKDHIAK